MSQQRAKNSNEANSSSNTRNNLESTASNAPSAIIVLDDDDDDEEEDVQIVNINSTVDLCFSPSTSAAAAAVAASNSLKANNTENNDADITPSTGETAAPLECPICLQTCIHPARLPCGHIFCFLCVKGVAYKNRRCAMCRREIPPEFLDHPQLVNGISDICVTRATEDGYQWYYEGRNGWWQYDDRTSQDIEEAFKKGEKSCTILVAGYVYIVDLEALVQQRQNEPTRCRRVKRDLATIPKKGVAGLRIEGNTVTTDAHFAQRHNQGQLSAAASAPAASLISTIAATDAAIRIASDIIGSTLAHADELTRGLAASNISDSAGDLSGEHANNFNSNTSTAGQALLPQYTRSLSQGAVTARSLASSHSNSIQDLMRSATEDLLDTTQQVIETNQHTIDLFEQALNDFQALTIHSFADSSDEDDDANVAEADEQCEAGEPPASQILPSRDRSNDGNGPLGF